MTVADGEAMTALQELLAERQRYEGWLRALDARRDSTPEHVYTRVRTDYVLRLDRVMQRLTERTEQLRATMESLATRLRAVQARETDRLDSRQEAEVRAAVGEFGADEWERIRGDADRELATLGEERSELESELAGLERIIGETSRPAGEPPADEPADGTQSPAAASSAPDAPAVASGASGSGPDVAERSPARSGNADERRGDQSSPSIEDFVAEWPVAGRPGEGAQPPSGASGGVRDTSGRPGSAAEGARQRPAPESVPALADTRREADKTLRCPECGAMNHATEWYCERCGGELSTF